MKTIEQLKFDLGVIKGLAQQAARITSDTDKLVAATKGDESRSTQWKSTQINTVERNAFARFHPIWIELQARYAELMDERDPWDVPMNCLGLYGMQGLPLGSASEATVRGQVLTELRMMPPLLLRMAAEGAAKARDWAKLYLACLVLLDKGQPLPTNLSTLPIGNIVDADEVFFEAELLYRQAEMDLSSIRGQQGRNNGRSIALGLLIQRQEDLRRARARALQLNWDEQQQQTQDTEQNSGDRSIALNVKGNM